MSNLSPESGHIWESGKVYSHSVGLSCCFRQWRAVHTHCKFLHGYALKVEFTFRRSSFDLTLDDTNWVMNFGGMKEVKKWLEETFDHKTLVAKDDPQLSLFEYLATDPNTDEPQDSVYDSGLAAPLIQLVVVDHVGCEAFARMIFDQVKTMLPIGVLLHEVKVSEHESNWASYGRAKP